MVPEVYSLFFPCTNWCSWLRPKTHLCLFQTHLAPAQLSFAALFRARPLFSAPDPIVKWLNLAISESHYCIPNAAQNTQIPRTSKLSWREHFLAPLDKGNWVAGRVYVRWCVFLKPVCWLEKDRRNDGQAERRRVGGAGAVVMPKID